MITPPTAEFSLPIGIHESLRIQQLCLGKGASSVSTLFDQHIEVSHLDAAFVMEGPERLRARAFTDCPPRTHQDLGQVYNNLHHNVPQYPPSSGLSYVANNSYMQYSNIPTSYSPFSPSYAPSPTPSQGGFVFSYTGGNSMPYSVQPPPRSATLPSQHRVFSRGYSSSAVHPHHTTNQVFMRTPIDYSLLHETEEQDSVNRESGRSEPIEPPLEGYPDVNDFDDLMKNYVAQLSPKKQDKALINARRAANIRYVLSNKKTTSVESAQFRFWAKKMFQLQPSVQSVSAEKRKICHENKPIAVREKLFKILTRAHQKCQHGGRDKTSAQVRKVYSWVPKELISRFVKLCPTCRERRGLAFPADDENSPTSVANNTDETPSAEIRSPLKRRRSEGMGTSDNTEVIDIPTQLVNSSSTFQNQNRWLSGMSHQQSTFDETYTPAPSYSSHASFTEMEPTTNPSQIRFSTMKDISNDARSTSSHSPRLKQGPQQKYE